jgi:hypothetical protein
MSQIIANFPLEESLTVNVEDYLTLIFTEACHPCWVPDDQGLFDPQLPHGDHKTGSPWIGKAIKAGTLGCSYIPCGQECGTVVEGLPKNPPRSITVGGGI